MHVDEQQILTFSRELLQSHLGLGLSLIPQNGDSVGDHGDGEKTWSSCIKASGGWQGAIVVECPESIARHAAATFFAADGEETSDDDIQDALKELAEMIGRRMRTLLPEETKLSRPSIVVDTEGEATLTGMQGLSDLRMSCEGRQMRIAVFESQADLAPAG